MAKQLGSSGKERVKGLGCRVQKGHHKRIEKWRTESRESDNSEKTVLRNWCIVPGEKRNIKRR